METNRKSGRPSVEKWTAIIMAITAIASLLLGIIVHFSNNENSKDSSTQVIIRDINTDPTQINPIVTIPSPYEINIKKGNVNPQNANNPTIQQPTVIEPITTKIFGQVQESNDLIKDAKVIFLDYDSACTTTDTDGCFEIYLPGKIENIRLKVEKDGYETLTSSRTITGKEIYIQIKKQVEK